MNNNKTKIVYYELINRLYSISYTALRFYEQRKIQASSENFQFKMPYQNKVSWTDTKMEGLNNLSEEFFRNYHVANEKNRQIFILSENEFERSKELLQYYHNVLFDKNCEFEEIFDGFLCKQKELLEFLYVCEMKPLMTNNIDIVRLVRAYCSYIEKLFDKTIVQSMFDVIGQLNNDFNSNGTPSLYSGIIQNDNVLKLSAEKLKEQLQQIESYYKELKSIKPDKFSGDAYTHDMCMNKCKELNAFVGQLEQRLKSANTDVNNGSADRIIENTMDFFTGTPKIKRAVIDEIYVTELELNYIQYLKEMLEFGLASLKESQQQKQENKEIGETQ